MTRSLALYPRPANLTPTLSWRVRQGARADAWKGLAQTVLAKGISRATGIVTVTCALRAQVLHARRWIDYGILSRRYITTNAVGYLVDVLQGGVDANVLKYHACGTGTNAENVSNIALQVECTTELDPASTRAEGTLTEGATGNVFKTVGVLEFGGIATVTEHGLFTAATGGTLIDRSVFTGIAVGAGDAIQFNYELTLNAGG